MALEIERKFFVVGNQWRRQYRSVHHICDAIAPFGPGKVRIRLDENWASITLKGPRSGPVRLEYEYPVPRAEAEQMIFALQPALRRKKRYHVPAGALTWYVDEHESPYRGLITAEVELECESQPLNLPSWIGEEITGQSTAWAFEMMMAAASYLPPGSSSHAGVIGSIAN